MRRDWPVNASVVRTRTYDPEVNCGEITHLFSVRHHAQVGCLQPVRCSTTKDYCRVAASSRRFRHLVRGRSAPTLDGLQAAWPRRFATCASIKKSRSGGRYSPSFGSSAVAARCIETSNIRLRVAFGYSCIASTGRRDASGRRVSPLQFSSRGFRLVPVTGERMKIRPFLVFTRRSFGAAFPHFAATETVRRG